MQLHLCRYKTALKRIREAQKSNASALDLSRLDLQEIPLDIAKLVRLKTLDLSQNYLTKIANLEHLTNLVGLDLSTNKLTEIKGLERLIQLTNLNLWYNQILSVKGLDYLTKLTELDLTRTKSPL